MGVQLRVIMPAGPVEREMETAGEMARGIVEYVENLGTWETLRMSWETDALGTVTLLVLDYESHDPAWD